MPLRDHFRSPANDKHLWNELHGGWPMMIVRQLYENIWLNVGQRVFPSLEASCEEICQLLRIAWLGPPSSTSAPENRWQAAHDAG